ncbi:MAG: hypothetical protein IKA02_04005, partial [Clostridia bacterium]|nr:hypothetical protein [Clostridia bacterium]
LVHAFHSTLEEVVYCDFLIIVVDASDDECLEHLAVTDAILNYFEANAKPKLFVFNKADNCTSERLYDLRLLNGTNGRVVSLSAKSGFGVEELISQLESLCRDGKKRLTFVFPYSEQSALSSFYNCAEVLDTTYNDIGTVVEAWVDEKTMGKYDKYIKR